MIMSSEDLMWSAHYVFIAPALVDFTAMSWDTPGDIMYYIGDFVSAKTLAFFDSVEKLVLYTIAVLYSLDPFQGAEWLSENYEVWALIFITIILGGTNVIANPMCSIKHSALSQSVAGNTKDIIQTAIGGYFFSDYVFSWINFSGICISFAGCGTYVYTNYVQQSGVESYLNMLNTLPGKIKNVFSAKTDVMMKKMKLKKA